MVKTQPLWGERDITRKSLDAQINVNQHNHLISLLSMIGPSPDWCIGKCFTMLGGASVYCLNVGSLKCSAHDAFLE